MNDRIKKQRELYWQQKELRNVSMLSGNYDQITKMRKKQDDVYKKFKFYEGMNEAIERNKKNETKSKSS